MQRLVKYTSTLVLDKPTCVQHNTTVRAIQHNFRSVQSSVRTIKHKVCRYYIVHNSRGPENNPCKTMFRNAPFRRGVIIWITLRYALRRVWLSNSAVRRAEKHALATCAHTEEHDMIRCKELSKSVLRNDAFRSALHIHRATRPHRHNTCHMEARR